MENVVRRLVGHLSTRKAAIVSLAEVTHDSRQSAQVLLRLLGMLLEQGTLRVFAPESLSYTHGFILDQYVKGLVSYAPHAPHFARFGGIAPREVFELIRAHNASTRGPPVSVLGVDMDYPGYAKVPPGASPGGARLVAAFNRATTEKRRAAFRRRPPEKGLRPPERVLERNLKSSLAGGSSMANRRRILSSNLSRAALGGRVLYYGFHVEKEETPRLRKQWGRRFVTVGLAAKSIDHGFIVRVPLPREPRPTDARAVRVLEKLVASVTAGPPVLQSLDGLIPPTPFETAHPAFSLMTTTARSRGTIRSKGRWVTVFEVDNPLIPVAAYDYIILLPHSSTG